MTGNTVTLHRVLKAPPEKVYKAFTQPAALASWIPPYGFICEVHHMDVKEGGSYKSSFTNFTTGKKETFGGVYKKVQKNKLLQYSDKFDNPALPGEMITTVHFNEVSCGTELHITQEGIPSMIPVELCYLGWQESLEKLKTLVEPDIKEG